MRELLTGVATKWKLRAANSYMDSRTPTRVDPRTGRGMVLDYILVPKKWQCRTMVAGPTPVSDHQMVVTVVRREGTAVELRRKEYRPTLVGWQPTDEEQAQRFRREADRLTRVDGDGERNGNMEPEEEEGERWRNWAREMTGSARRIKHATAQQKCHALPKPPELWNAERQVMRTW